MKIVFFGTSQFAVSALKGLKANRHSVVAAVTQPAKKAGRHLKIFVSPIEKEAQRMHIPTLQPHSINEKDFINKLKGFDADFFVVVAFGEILKRDILDIPKFGCLNIHASLLPKYRGAAPVHRAVINGEEKTGVTIIRMNERLDAGDIVLQKDVKIEKGDTSKTLDDRLAAIGAELLIETIEAIGKGEAQFLKQDDRDATFAPKLTKKDGLINWNLNTVNILNRIRGLKPWPGTYTFLEGYTLKIISAEEAKGTDFKNFLPAEVVVASEDNGLVVKTQDGAISVLELQIEGRRELSAELFLRGHKIEAGTKLG